MTNQQTRAFYLKVAERLESHRQFRCRLKAPPRRTAIKVPFYMTGEEKVFFTLYVGLAVAVCAFAVYLCLA
jgi:hypothetical protein